MLDNATKPPPRAHENDPSRDEAVDDPDQWVAAHGDALFRAALNRVGDRAAAEDLVQETLLAALRGLDGFDRRSSFRTWLFAILKRRVADHFRRQGRDRTAAGECEDLSDFDRTGSWARTPAAWRGGPIRTALDATSDHASPARKAEHAELWEVVLRCAGDLPEHLGRVLRSRAIEQESTGEVCEQEGITQKNLSVRMHRARMLLRRCLEQKWFCRNP